jgi:hypothetical protein
MVNAMVNWIDRNAHVIIIVTLVACIVLLGMHIKQMQASEHYAAVPSKMALMQTYPDGTPFYNYADPVPQFQQLMEMNPDFNFQDNPFMNPSANMMPNQQFSPYT